MVIRPSTSGRSPSRGPLEREEAPSRRFVVDINPQAEPRSRGSPPRQSEYVTVKLPILNQPPYSRGNVTVALEYRIRRRYIAQFLPNATQAIHHGVLDLGSFLHQVLCNNPAEQIRDACIFVCDFISHWARPDREETENLFAEIHEELWSARDRTRAVVDAAVRLLCLCVVLHRRNGLGCAGELRHSVGHLASRLFHRWGPHLSPDQWVALFPALLGITGPDSRGLRDRLYRIWTGFGFHMRQRVVQLLFEKRNSSESAWEDWVLLMDLEYRCSEGTSIFSY
ncbi:hypothetical protein ACRE_040350 [Hapsidospora chrysogenum ATCC 11550]|uniref:Uncharacterized protein n=1 Tax=Hapsidospora chrysogenum (strain ATCC 11550 / CBS 779.69 / DSM 880 / IAM 14645 / JCM 23072 / IMI 49137) TaxID=857340 RepID=A0A086T717_HAPC1|nr:hypothetical protein ACRE_040350 [Hapsidospora chrysogenum ATCC 11550]